MASPLAAQPSATPPLGADLATLIAHLHAHHPALQATQSDTAAARERVMPATALPDPRLAIELMDVTNSMAPGRPTSLLPGQVGTTTWRAYQMLPYPGKRVLRGEIATAAADGVLADALQTRLDLEAALRRAHIAHFQAAQQAQVLNDSLTLNQQLEALALRRYTLGLASQQEVWQLQAESTALRIQALDLAQVRAAAQARLNALLARDPQAPLAEAAALPPLPATVDLAELQQRARLQSPQLMRSQAALDAAQRNTALTGLERYPDFGVSVANNRPRAGRSSWDVMLEVNIPLQQASRRAREREAAHVESAAQSRLQDAELRLASALASAHAALQARHDQLRLVRHTLLPQTQASLASARAGYENGTVGLATVIEAQQRQLRTRLTLLDTEVGAALVAVELAQLTGEMR